MWWLVSGINRPILEKYNGIDSVGIFSVANKFPSLLTIVFGIFIYAWQISVLEEFNKPGYHNFYNKILRVIFFVLSFLTIALNVSSEAIVSFIVDEKYYVSWQYIPILSIAVLFSSLAGFVGTNFSATRESKYYFYSSVWGAIASVVISYILIPRYGMIGASLSVVFSHVVMALSRIIYSWKIVKIDNMYIYICSLVTCIVSSYLTLALDSILAKCLISCCLCLVLFYINKDAIASLKIYYSKLKSR
ncbi:polysaccharide biosynthesis protein cpsM [Vibrio sp. JCM 19236]|nr:polysaccharide biosynthesis protein cpsM [Vibrio sp. JCM 19236]